MLMFSLCVKVSCTQNIIGQITETCDELDLSLVIYRPKNAILATDYRKYNIYHRLGSVRSSHAFRWPDPRPHIPSAIAAHMYNSTHELDHHANSNDVTLVVPSISAVFSSSSALISMSFFISSRDSFDLQEAQSTNTSKAQSCRELSAWPQRHTCMHDEIDHHKLNEMKTRRQHDRFRTG